MGATGPVGTTGPAECFTFGTRIATPSGERLIETLRVGDLLLTTEGRSAPIRWIGRRHVALAAHPRPEFVRPVRISAHAFESNLPRRDLMVSPGHGILWGNEPTTQVLIPAGELVDGRTVVRLDIASVDYIHIELDRHDIILAEGLPAESYLDTGARTDFEGSAALALHPTFAVMAHETACRPFAIHGPEVEAARAALAVRPVALRNNEAYNMK